MMMMMMMIMKVMEASVAVETWRSSILTARFLAQYLSGSHPSSFACWRRLKSLKSYEMCQWAAVSSFCCSAYRVSHQAVGFPAGLQTFSSFLPFFLPSFHPLLYAYSTQSKLPYLMPCCWLLVVGYPYPISNIIGVLAGVVLFLLDPFLSIIEILDLTSEIFIYSSILDINDQEIKHRPMIDRGPSTVRP